MDFIPKGIIPAMVAALTKDGKVNEKALRTFTDYLIKGGSHGLFVVGPPASSTGFRPRRKRSSSKSPSIRPVAGCRCMPEPADHHPRGHPADPLRRAGQGGRGLGADPHVHQPESEGADRALHGHRRLNRAAGAALQQPAEDRREPGRGHGGEACRRAQHRRYQGLLRRLHPYGRVHPPDTGQGLPCLAGP